MSPKCPTDVTLCARVRSATKAMCLRDLVVTSVSRGHNPGFSGAHRVRNELIQTAMTAPRGHAEEVRK